MDSRSIPRLNDQEAHRALELLEDYHSKLTRPQDKQLRNAIERVIKIFKNRLFQALLDIQEFYEITLLDDTKSIQQKTAETLQIACKWENSPPLSGLNYLNNEIYRCHLHQKKILSVNKSAFIRIISYSQTHGCFEKSCSFFIKMNSLNTSHS